MPPASIPRAVYWDHETVIKVLDHMAATENMREAGRVMTVIFGTGMELGAALAMTGSVGSTVLAHGTKNLYRRNRVVFLSNWARKRFEPIVHSTGLLFHITDQEVRAAFYQAQVDVGLVNEPPRSERGNKLWAKVAVHTIHDARHTYAVTKALGLDGEWRMSVKAVAHQLGYRDQQLVLRIYAKANIEERLRLLELAAPRDVKPTTPEEQ